MIFFRLKGVGVDRGESVLQYREPGDGGSRGGGSQEERGLVQSKTVYNSYCCCERLCREAGR
jgi:hypothetical protein